MALRLNGHARSSAAYSGASRERRRARADVKEPHICPGVQSKARDGQQIEALGPGPQLERRGRAHLPRQAWRAH